MNDFDTILSSLLLGKKLNQPFNSPISSGYRKELNVKLDEYVRRIKGLKSRGVTSNFLKNNLKEIIDINKKILRAIDYYLDGNAGKAYDEIENLMNLTIVQKALDFMTSDLETYQSNFHDDDCNDHVDKHFSFKKSLYRVRQSECQLSKRQDIFHIPFGQRHLVKTQRYSIAGLPCLYLGSSLYVCWQEMGRPNLDNLYLSRYRVSSSRKINVLNFAYSLETLKDKINMPSMLFDEGMTENEEQALFVMWPILAACSFNVQFPDSSFCIEYIFPNLLLQWISKETKISGVMYLSTKTTQIRDKGLEVNFVFPPTQNSIKNDFCEDLRNTFKWSRPISWQILNTLEDVPSEDVYSYVSKIDNVEKQITINYATTTFYKMEYKLHMYAKISNQV